MQLETVVAVLSLLATIASVVPIYIGYLRNNPKRLLLIAVHLHSISSERWRIDVTFRNQGKADIPSASFDAGRPIEVLLGRETRGLEWADTGSRSDHWALTDRPSVVFSPGLLKKGTDLAASVILSGRPDVRIEAPLRDIPVKELIGLGAAPAVLQTSAPVAPKHSSPAAPAPFAPPPATAVTQASETTVPSYPPPSTTVYGSPAVSIPIPPPFDRPRDASSLGIALPPLQGQRRQEPVLRGGFGIWAALGCGVAGFVPTITGSLVSSDALLSHALMSIGVLLGMTGLFGLIGTFAIRLLRRAIESPASWRTPAERLRRPGTVLVLAITYAGLILFTTGYIAQGPNAETTHWAAGFGAVLLLLAIPASGIVGLVRLISALSLRSRSTTGYPHPPA